MEILKQRVLQALGLTDDFYNHINEGCLGLKISDVPSNTFGEQAYCIIGARESYLKALKLGQWAGFDCSLIQTNDKTLISSKLEETHRNIENFLQDNCIGEINNNLLIDLLEHEVQHHGQLIRFAYANKIKFPKSWNIRYTV
ncbi:hypothetical protein IMZ08_17900 [Bacillus luteolus]|uniref:DinB family protein n=1 Tax=Litchfieldia luteola TaxID=682179 RepID=A0ABR9QN58_9BACI|nr:hypothetical protein [Cytobacillus luteolus]MBE4909912.1 hypothetical protein [Cytobacillus luteolus]MBP1942533.1 hypothetical protein [Cytobacillus luteolus]